MDVAISTRASYAVELVVRHTHACISYQGSFLSSGCAPVRDSYAQAGPSASSVSSWPMVVQRRSAKVKTDRTNAPKVSHSIELEHLTAQIICAELQVLHALHPGKLRGQISI